MAAGFASIVILAKLIISWMLTWYGNLNPKKNNMIRLRKKLLTSPLGAMLLGAALFLPSLASAAPTFDFMDGCNWADPRDNYVNGILVMSGVGANSSNATHKAKAKELAGYAKSRGMNSIRVPTNPDTIANSDQWGKFKNRLNGINGLGMNTLICHWDGGGSNKDGRLDDQDDWETMWQTINAQYQSWSRVYYSPFNEPFGLSTSELKTLFDNDFIDVIGKGDTKILINGKGYDDNVAEIAKFPAFNNCGFSQHIYPWYNNRYGSDQAAWKKEVEARIGSAYHSRSVITEFGLQTSADRNFLDGISSAPDTVKFVRGICEAGRKSNIGLMWWPGWRSGDSFRMWEDTGSNTLRNDTLDNLLDWGFH